MAEIKTRTGQGWIISLFLLVLSLLASLLLTEGLLRLAGAAGLVDLTPTLQDLALSAESLVVLPDELESELNPAAGDEERPLYIRDPVLNHRMAPNWSGYFPEEMVEQVGRSQVPIQTNSLGLRGPEVALAKPESLFRILILGDSVTFGWGVRQEDTYASQLAGLLALLKPGQRFEVINAGVSGYGTWQQLLWLQSVGLQLDPDLVVVQVHLNDAADNLWGGWAWQADGSIAPIDTSRAEGRAVRNTAGAGRLGFWLGQHSELYRLVRRLATAREATGSGGGASCEDNWNVDQQQVCWETTEALLSGLRAVAAQHDALVVLLLSPMHWQVEDGIQDPRSWVDNTLYQQKLAAFAGQQGLPVIDPLAALRSAYAGGQDLFLNVGHPNEAGQRILAQELYSGLARAGLLP